MITKGASRNNRRFFAKHFLNTKQNERVRVVGVHGFGHENVNAAWRDMEAFAADKPNCKNYFFALSLNPEPGEVLSEEQWQEAEAVALRHYGAEGQPYISFEHVKNGRLHRHLAIARVDRESGELISDSLTYKRNEAISREIERELGLNPTASVLVKGREGPRPARRPKDYEGFRASQTGLKTEQVSADVTRLWHETLTGEELREALQECGYIACNGKKGILIVDPAGKEHLLSRRVEGVKAADVWARVADIDRDTLPSLAEAKKMATAWGNTDSEAARAVRHKELDDRLAAFRDRTATEPGPDWQGFMEHAQRAEYQPEWSSPEAEGGRQRQRQREADLSWHERMVARNAAKASRDVLHDAGPDKERGAYTTNEAINRAAHTPAGGWEHRLRQDREPELER